MKGLSVLLSIFLPLPMTTISSSNRVDIKNETVEYENEYSNGGKYSEANLIVKGKVIYLKGQRSYNKYCGILAKECVARANFAQNINYYGSISSRWFSSSWVYGAYPEACRVLTQRY